MDLMAISSAKREEIYEIVQRFLLCRQRKTFCAYRKRKAGMRQLQT